MPHVSLELREPAPAPPRIEPAGADEAGPMEIGVAATPPMGGELDLAYGELWARGFSTSAVCRRHARLGIPGHVESERSGLGSKPSATI